MSTELLTPRAAGPAPAAPTVRPDERTDTRPSTGDGDHDRFSHYVKKDEMTKALVEGTPVRALCGKIWVPSRDPDRYPTCPACEELMGILRASEGDGDQG